MSAVVTVAPAIAIDPITVEVIGSALLDYRGNGRGAGARLVLYEHQRRPAGISPLVSLTNR